MLKKQQRNVEVGPYPSTTPDAYSNMNGTPLNLVILSSEQNTRSATRGLPLPSTVQHSPGLTNGFNELDNLLQDLHSDQYSVRTQRTFEDVSKRPTDGAVRHFSTNGQLDQPSPVAVKNNGWSNDSQRVTPLKYDLINEVHSNPVIVASYTTPSSVLLPSKPTLVNGSVNGVSRQSATRSVELDSLISSLNELDQPVASAPRVTVATTVTSVGSSPNSSQSSSSSIRRSATSSSPSSSANWATINGGRIGSASETSASGGSGTPKRNGSPHVSFADDLVKVIPLGNSQQPPHSPPTQNGATPKPSTLKKTVSAPNKLPYGSPVPTGSSPIVLVQNVESGPWSTPNAPTGRSPALANGSIVRTRPPEESLESDKNLPRMQPQPPTESSPALAGTIVRNGNAGHIAPANDSRSFGPAVQTVTISATNESVRMLPPPPPPPPRQVALQDEETVYDTLEMYQQSLRQFRYDAPVNVNVNVNASIQNVDVDDDIPLRVQPILASVPRGSLACLQNASPRSANAIVNGNSNACSVATAGANSNANASTFGSLPLSQVESKNSPTLAKQGANGERQAAQLNSPATPKLNVNSIANYSNSNTNASSSTLSDCNASEEAPCGVLSFLRNVSANELIATSQQTQPAALIDPPAQYQTVTTRTTTVNYETHSQNSQNSQSETVPHTTPSGLYTLTAQQYSADSLSLTGSTVSSRLLDDRLQSTSPPTCPAVNCVTCGEALSGRAISAMGKFWHPEHFRCAVCHDTIGTQRFFERAGEPFCELCYLEQFAPRCAQCDHPILDKCVTALGKNWHYEHFTCAACNCLFDPVAGFLEHDGRAYCVTDYYANFGAKCTACDKAIGAEAFINAFGKQYHRACWKCAECGRNFDNSSSFCELDGRPVCDRHFNAPKNTNSSAPVPCAKCNRPIATRCVTALARKYHPECFVCTFCMRPLVHDFRERDAKPYCSGCYCKLIK